MNFLKKTFVGAMVAGTMALSAQAAVVTVGGVTWDTDAPIDFSGTTDTVNQLIGAGGVVSGTGLITKINNSGGFCSGCTLSFEFGNFQPLSGALPAPGATGNHELSYKDGWVKVYVNYDAGGRDVWLDMVGHAIEDLDGATLDGTIRTVRGEVASMSGGGYLDVVGGLAAAYFDTNAMIDGADFTFSTTFTSYFPDFTNAVGSGTFTSRSTSEVPEPASVALIGLGLLGLVAGRRRVK